MEWVSGQEEVVGYAGRITEAEGIPTHFSPCRELDLADTFAAAFDAYTTA